MNFRRLPGLVVPMAAFTSFVAACGSSPSTDTGKLATSSGSGETTASAEPLRIVQHFAVVANETTTLSMPVAPDAECKFHGLADSPVFLADGRGRLHFGVSASTAGDADPLDCAHRDGTVDYYALDIAIAPSPDGVVASTLDESKLPTLRARPALREDPSTLSDDELVSRGFPPPPNRDVDSAGYKAWLAVTREDAVPMTVHPGASRHDARAAQKAKGRTERAKGAPVAASSYSSDDGGNWSGFMTEQSGLVSEAVGQWTVPTIAATGNNMMYQWVGLGGYDWNDANTAQEALIQAGTMSQAYPAFNKTYTQYNAFIEYFPGPIEELAPAWWGYQAIANTEWKMAVTPGDQYTVQVWTAGLPASTGWYFVAAYPVTGQAEYYIGSLQFDNASGFIPFQGWTAEWIVEAPQLSLSNFGQTNIHGAVAYGPGGYTQTIGDNNPGEILYGENYSGGIEDWPIWSSGTIGFWWLQN